MLDRLKSCGERKLSSTKRLVKETRSRLREHRILRLDRVMSLGEELSGTPGKRKVGERAREYWYNIRRQNSVPCTARQQ